MAKIVPIKQCNNFQGGLEDLSKEELIAKIKSLEAHNIQLQNIIAKSKQSNREKSKTNTFDFSRCKFRHILLRIVYLGWDYQGFAVQEDTTNTIEYHLFDALKKTCLIKDRQSSNYHRCGRTDKGVSSFGQVISITVRSKSEDVSNEINYCKILNRVLPNNIQCVAWSPTDESYSARFNCKSRTYHYYFPKGNLDFSKMREASNFLLGTHDFRNLCKMDVGNGVTQFIRTILDVQIEPVESSKLENVYAVYKIVIKAQSFLWHQIRCIVAILLLVGQKKEEPSVVTELLDITKHPRKPEYNMASEIPLNLFYCDYEDVQWNYSAENLEHVLQNFRSQWMFSAIKQVMLKEIIEELEKQVRVDQESCGDSLVGNLIQGVKSKKYVPVMKRQKCDSLEDKIKHFAKRKRIIITSEEKT